MDIPASVDLSQNFVLDDSAPRSDLGLGVSSIELAVGLQRTHDLNQSHKVHQTLATIQEPPAGGLPALPSAPTPAAPAKSRVLQQRASDEASEAAAAEFIAKNCKDAFDANQISSPDPLNSNNVAFWVLRYKAHVLREFGASNKDPAAFRRCIFSWQEYVHGRNMVMTSGFDFQAQEYVLKWAGTMS